MVFNVFSITILRGFYSYSSVLNAQKSHNVNAQLYR